MKPFACLRLVAACLAASFAIGAAAADDIVVGQVAPLSGVLADTGKDMVLGVKVYLDQVNDQGGVNGRKIRHVVKDDGYKVDETVRMTKELIEKDAALALIGFAGTGNVGELLKQKILENAGIALVAPYTGGEILRTPFNPNIFHIRASYADETEGIVNQLVQLNMKRIGVMYQDDPFGKAGLAGVEAALKKRGLELVVTGAYEKNTDNVADAVKAIAKANPQAVVMISVNKSAAAFSKEIRAVSTVAQLVNISVVNPKEIVRLIGAENARGIGMAQVMPYPLASSIPIVKDYQQALKKYAPGVEFSYTSFEEFVGAKVLVEGLRRAGKNLTRQSVIQGLESMNSFDTGGFTVRFSPTNRIGSRFVEITVIGKDGRLLR